MRGIVKAWILPWKWCGGANVETLWMHESRETDLCEKDKPEMARTKSVVLDLRLLRSVSERHTEYLDGEKTSIYYNGIDGLVRLHAGLDKQFINT